MSSRRELAGLFVSFNPHVCPSWSQVIYLLVDNKVAKTGAPMAEPLVALLGSSDDICWSVSITVAIPHSSDMFLFLAKVVMIIGVSSDVLYFSGGEVAWSVRFPGGDPTAMLRNFFTLLSIVRKSFPTKFHLGIMIDLISCPPADCSLKLWSLLLPQDIYEAYKSEDGFPVHDLHFWEHLGGPMTELGPDFGRS